MFSVLFVGWLSDRVQAYKLNIVINFIILGFEYLLIQDMLNNDEEWFTIWFDISFVIVLGIHVCVFMLCITMISKLCNETTRGTIFNVNGMIGSIFILVIQGLGGHLYQTYSKTFPFVFSFVAFLIFNILSILFGFM